MKCWIITEGLAGTENQCLGVAEALGAQPEVKRVQLKQPWRFFSPFLKFENAGSFIPPLQGPWPDVLIASGRKSIAAARFVRKSSAGKTFTVQIQDPRICPENFDLVAVPEHDPTRGENVIVTAASPNRITDRKLSEARDRFKQFEKIKVPRIAVLIGGDSKSHKMPTALTKKLAEQLKGLNTGLMVTTSRRTGEENTAVLRSVLMDPGFRRDDKGGQDDKESRNDDVWFWDGSGENPYFGMLAWADYILVTSDSASMLSDAATTGKPVYMIPLDGGSRRLDKLHENLRTSGIARVFEGKLEKWTYEPLRDSQKIAEEIRKRLAGHTGRAV